MARRLKASPGIDPTLTGNQEAEARHRAPALFTPPATSLEGRHPKAHTDLSITHRISRAQWRPHGSQPLGAKSTDVGSLDVPSPKKPSALSPAAGRFQSEEELPWILLSPERPSTPRYSAAHASSYASLHTLRVDSYGKMFARRTEHPLWDEWDH